MKTTVIEMTRGLTTNPMVKSALKKGVAKENEAEMEAQLAEIQRQMNDPQKLQEVSNELDAMDPAKIAQIPKALSLLTTELVSKGTIDFDNIKAKMEKNG